MLKYNIDNWRLVRVGTTQAQRKLFFGLRKARNRLERMGGNADPAALAAHLEVKESEVVAMLECGVLAPGRSAPRDQQ
jgi:RNA polymerase sigma-32 factor